MNQQNRLLERYNRRQQNYISDRNNAFLQHNPLFNNNISYNNKLQKQRRNIYLAQMEQQKEIKQLKKHHCA